jgi:hypothetical protein
MLIGMKQLSPILLMGIAVIIGIIALALLINALPRLAGMRQSTSSVTQSDGYLRGNDSFNLPGSAYYGNLTPPMRQNGTPTTPAIKPQATACTMEAKICPDGSAVGRTGPNCEFTPCPTN